MTLLLIIYDPSDWGLAGTLSETATTADPTCDKTDEITTKKWIKIILYLKIYL